MGGKRRRGRLEAHLADLADLAMDLRWTGSRMAGRLWERLDADAWERTSNPHQILLGAPRDRLAEVLADRACRTDLDAWLARRKRYGRDGGWYGREHAGAKLRRVAYFSMEFGLAEALPIYSGGLGILAGDHLKAASDLGVPLVGVGLLYQQGYFRQVLGPDGSQLEALPYNDPSGMPVRPVEGPDGAWPRIELELPGRVLFVRPWQARVGKVTLYLLDSNDPLNNPWDRGITANLYAAGKEKRLLQEIVLGVGGWRLLEALDIEPDVCHLNEGHAAFAVLARAGSFARRHAVHIRTALRATRAGNVFTTHTPIEAAFDRFDTELVARYAGPFLENTSVPLDLLLGMGRRDPEDRAEPFNMAYLALRGSAHANGVSRLHGRVSRRLFHHLFPGRPVWEVPVGSITNGVHAPTWDSAALDDLLKRAMPEAHWTEDLEGAAGSLAALPAVDLWAFRGAARGALVEYVRRRFARQVREKGATAGAVERAAHVLDPNALTLGFARRFTDYKRPTLLLRDADRFARLLKDPARPVQLVVAGKAHPNDDQGKDLVRQMAAFAGRPDLSGRVVFLEDHDMVLAQRLAGGVDVWINLPRRPAEACGTSGMKVVLNGGLHLSVLDGWWDAAYAPEAGWAIGGREDGDGGAARDQAEAEQLYALLEGEVVPAFHDRDPDGVPQAWVERVRQSMMRYLPRFSADRMVREYVEEAYLPAARAFRRRAAHGARAARDLEVWGRRVAREWAGIRFVEVEKRVGPDGLAFSVAVYLGGLEAGDVRVEMYAEPAPGRETPRVVVLEQGGVLPGAVNGFRYVGTAPPDRPPGHYTARVVPYHRDARVPLETSLTCWAT